MRQQLRSLLAWVPFAWDCWSQSPGTFWRKEQDTTIPPTTQGTVVAIVCIPGSLHFVKGLQEGLHCDASGTCAIRREQEEPGSSAFLWQKGRTRPHALSRGGRSLIGRKVTR